MNTISPPYEVGRNPEREYQVGFDQVRGLGCGQLMLAPKRVLLLNLDGNCCLLDISGNAYEHSNRPVRHVCCHAQCSEGVVPLANRAGCPDFTPRLRWQVSIVHSDYLISRKGASLKNHHARTRTHTHTHTHTRTHACYHIHHILPH